MKARSQMAWCADLLARLFLSGVFVYASWSKIQDPGLFAGAVDSYGLLPTVLSGWVAIVLPMTEALAALALVVTKWSREAAALMGVMLLVFLIGLTQAWIRGLEISCGCFGPEEGDPLPLWVDILRDIGLMIPVLWLMMRPNRWILGR